MPLLTLWSWLALAVVAAPLSGSVVDEDGKAVPGATVWLTASRQFGEDAETRAEVETDAEGRFSIDAPPEGDRTRQLMLWAFAPGPRVAISVLGNRPKGDERSIRLTLAPPWKTPVRVFGSDGKAVAGAKVRPPLINWPAALGERLEATTDAEGRADFRFRAGPGFRFDVTAEGLVTQGHRVADDEVEKTIRLLPVGQISARLVAADPKVLAGWTVVASTRPDDAGGPFFPTSRGRGQSDGAGKVSFPPLAVGLVTFQVVPPEGSPFLGVPPTQVPLRDGENVAVKIPVRKGVKVEGSVREHESGKPVAGVKVNLFRLSQGRGNDDLVTDAEGRFSLYLLPGKVRVSLTWHELPDRYYYAPDNAHWADYDLAVGEDQHTLAPLKVWPATVIKGNVVDEAGKPVVGVGVVGSGTASRFGSNPIPGSTLSDNHGAFELGHMPFDSTVKLGGSTNRFDIAPVTVRVNAQGVQDAPVTLRAVRRPTVSVRGRVLGPGGVPVSGAWVLIFSGSGQGQDLYGLAREEKTRTGPDGTYQTPKGVTLSDQYRATVTAAGFVEASSEWAKAPAGELPDVVMRRVSRLRSVSGRVIDADGQGVAGAEVFQAGDGPRRTSDTTNAEGRFTVAGVFDTPAFVFVKKDGFRFTGRKVGAGDEPVEIVVSRVDGPAPAALKPAAPPLTRAEEKAKARALLAPVWAQFKPGVPVRPEPFEIGPTLALVDTPRIVEMIENQVLHADGPLLTNIALGLYEESPGDAIATLDAIRPSSAAAEALLNLFDRVPDAPADFRRDLLTHALARAREGDEPTQRVALLARVADRWFQAGEPEKARPLVDEARAAFKNLAGGALLELRSDLANALARVDLPAALALLDGNKEARQKPLPDASSETIRKQVDSWDTVEVIVSTGPSGNQEKLAAVARRAAATDPAGAVRVFGKLTQRLIRLNALPDTCAGMATRDLTKAIDLATRLDCPGVAALTVAVGARNKAAADPAEAKRLLADTFDRLEPLRGQMVVPAVAMARLLPLAVRVDPDRSAEYLWRALARRPPRVPALAPGRATPQIRQQFLIHAQQAALVARFDREAAEVVFAPVAEKCPCKRLIDDDHDLRRRSRRDLAGRGGLRPPRGPGDGRRPPRRPRRPQPTEEPDGPAAGFHAPHQADGPAGGRPRSGPATDRAAPRGAAGERSTRPLARRARRLIPPCRLSGGSRRVRAS